MTAEAEGDPAGIRELVDRLLADPARADALTAYALAILREEEAALEVVEHQAAGADVWLSGLARMFRAQFAENAGDLDRTRIDVDAALARFRQAGDRWGQATVLPMRAQLRQYDDDLDGALADLRESRSLAAEFGPLCLSDEVFSDLRWIDLHLRCGDTDLTAATIDSARERARRANSPEMLALVDAWEAVFRLRLSDLDGARTLLDTAERGLHGETAFPGDHARTLVGSVRAALCVALGDLPGAAEALTLAYAAALATRDLPIMSVVAVNVAALAEAHGRHHESAVLLGAASRLRGAHDRTDPQVRDLTRQGRTALGEAPFTAAYDKGWALDGKTAVTEVDPSRLRP